MKSSFALRRRLTLEIGILGAKYVCQGILFKLALDSAGLYGSGPSNDVI